MTHLSLTSRLSLMFTLLVLSVLLLTGTVFKQLSLMHFRTLDQQELESKLHSAAKLLQNVHSRQQFALRAAEFDALFGHHERLLATIVGPDNQIWLRHVQGSEAPAPRLNGGAPVGVAGGGPSVSRHEPRNNARGRRW
ncbi:hypothetical protein [Marinobacterium aestuariivivens]|uniref:CusS-like sensor domain-containing protein n=1 Tax=Marinobacterium aestuariivivens TaxID=1698799 RepID=A0ABW2A8N6_9GAMM